MKHDSQKSNSSKQSHGRSQKVTPQADRKARIAKAGKRHSGGNSRQSSSRLESDPPLAQDNTIPLFGFFGHNSVFDMASARLGHDDAGNYVILRASEAGSQLLRPSAYSLYHSSPQHSDSISRQVAGMSANREPVIHTQPRTATPAPHRSSDANERVPGAHERSQPQVLPQSARPRPTEPKPEMKDPPEAELVESQKAGMQIESPDMLAKGVRAKEAASKEKRRDAEALVPGTAMDIETVETPVQRQVQQKKAVGEVRRRSASVQAAVKEKDAEVRAARIAPPVQPQTAVPVPPSQVKGRNHLRTTIFRSAESVVLALEDFRRYEAHDRRPFHVPLDHFQVDKEKRGVVVPELRQYLKDHDVFVPEATHKGPTMNYLLGLVTGEYKRFSNLRVVKYPAAAGCYHKKHIVHALQTACEEGEVLGFGIHDAPLRDDLLRMLYIVNPEHAILTDKPPVLLRLREEDGTIIVPTDFSRLVTLDARRFRRYVGQRKDEELAEEEKRAADVVARIYKGTEDIRIAVRSLLKNLNRAAYLGISLNRAEYDKLKPILDIK